MCGVTPARPPPPPPPPRSYDAAAQLGVAASFAGAAFDGRFIYIAPGPARHLRAHL